MQLKIKIEKHEASSIHDPQNVDFLYHQTVKLEPDHQELFSYRQSGESKECF